MLLAIVVVLVPYTSVSTPKKTKKWGYMVYGFPASVPSPQSSALSTKSSIGLQVSRLRSYNALFFGCSLFHEGY